MVWIDSTRKKKGEKQSRAEEGNEVPGWRLKSWAQEGVKDGKVNVCGMNEHTADWGFVWFMKGTWRCQKGVRLVRATCLALGACGACVCFSRYQASSDDAGASILAMI